jgi:ketosteroid isomerase-like protein
LPSQNADIVRRAFDIFNSYDEGPGGPEEVAKAFDQFAEIAAPDIEYHEPREWPGARVLHSVDEYREVMGVMLEALEGMRAEIEDLFESGDQVVVFVRFTAQGTSSGAGAEVRPGQVFTLRDGKITKQEVFLDRDEAMKAAGLSR